MLGADDQVQHALELAFRHLNRRERTVDEVRSHLTAEGIREAVVERTIGEMSELGYLDDARFAGLFIQDKRALDNWGSERITRALLARGVDRELIAAALSGEHRDDELERALALLRRRFPDPPQERRERERALGVLLRKGYDSELALDAVSQYGREA